MKATQSEIKAADESTKPFRFVLHDRFGIVSTHMETDPGTEKHAFHHGH